MEVMHEWLSETQGMGDGGGGDIMCKASDDDIDSWPANATLPAPNSITTKNASGVEHKCAIDAQNVNVVRMTVDSSVIHWIPRGVLDSRPDPSTLLTTKLADMCHKQSLTLQLMMVCKPSPKPTQRCIVKHEKT